MINRYLSDRAYRRSRMSRDERNPYGSRGGYVSSRRMRDRGMEDMYRGGRERSRGNDREMDYNYDMPEYDSRYDYRGYSYDRGEDYHRGSEYPREHSRPMQYELYGIGGMRPRMDYDYDYGYDYAKESEKEYEKDLHEWVEKLKKYDRFGWSKEQVIQQAKDMGVKFEKYDEMEFYATYLMLMSDFKKIGSDPYVYLSMAKEFLEDDDAKLKGSEKICAYLYTIVKGEEE